MFTKVKSISHNIGITIIVFRFHLTINSFQYSAFIVLHVLGFGSLQLFIFNIGTKHWLGVFYTQNVVVSILSSKFENKCTFTHYSNSATSIDT